MNSSVLSALLDRQLIGIESDEQLEKAQATAKQVAAKIKSKKLSAATCTLVAMDSAIAADDPTVLAVLGDLTTNWKTVRTKYPDPPVTLLRAVLAESLTQAAHDPNVAGIIWYTAKSYWPHATIDAEWEIWVEILKEIGERAERAASDAWEGAGTSEIGEEDHEIPDVKPGRVDVATLTAHLGAAAGPIAAPPNGVATNQHQAGAQYGGTAHPEWARIFGETAATGIAATVNNALKRTVDSVAAALTQALTSLSESAKSGRATALRSQVLWWKEAVYSNSLKKSYRELDVAIAALAMGSDLASIVPAHSPSSLDFLLGESARRIFGSGEQMTLLGFAETLRSQDVSARLLGKTKNADGRLTLLDFLRGVVGGTVDIDCAQTRTGISGQEPLPVAELAVWVFRDLQATRIASGK